MQITREIADEGEYTALYDPCRIDENPPLASAGVIVRCLAGAILWDERRRRGAKFRGQSIRVKGGAGSWFSVVDNVSLFIAVVLTRPRVVSIG